MNFSELAAKRYSCRKFTDEVVSQADINEILKAGHLAPTGCNNQPQRILVCNSEESIQKVREVSRCHFGCKTAMLVCYDRDECWVRKYDGMNCGVSDSCSVIVHMLLKVAELDVGTTWVMHFDPVKARREFNIPENIIPVGFIMMGYPAEDAMPAPFHSQFRDMDDVVIYDTF